MAFPAWCSTRSFYTPAFAAGVGIGAAMGSATQHMGLWLSLGAGLGAAFASLRRR